MNKKEMFEDILKHYGVGNYRYVDNGNDDVIVNFDQTEIKGEIAFTSPITLSLFLSMFGLICSVDKAERFTSSTMFYDLTKFLCKKKKGLKISQSDMGSLIVVSSFLENFINKK